MNPKNDPAMKRAEQSVAVIGVSIALGAYGAFGFSMGASALVGALLATVNLIVLARSVSKLLGGESPKWGLVAFLKFVLLFAATFALIRRGLVIPIGLAAGFGALPLGILAASVFGGPAVDESHPEMDAPARKEIDHA